MGTKTDEDCTIEQLADLLWIRYSEAEELVNELKSAIFRGVSVYKLVKLLQKVNVL